MTKVQAEELEDKFVLAVLPLIFYATINKKHFSFAPLSEAELAVCFFEESEKSKGEKVWAKPLPLVQHGKGDMTSVQPSREGLTEQRTVLSPRKLFYTLGTKCRDQVIWT